MGVHPRERELQRGDPVSRPRLEKGPPRPRRAARILDRGQEQVGEHDVEPRDERGVGERDAVESCVHALGDRQVEPRERRDAVVRPRER